MREGREEGGGALCVASAPERRIALTGSRPALWVVHCHPKGGMGRRGRSRRRILIKLGEDDF